MTSFQGSSFLHNISIGLSDLKEKNKHIRFLQPLIVAASLIFTVLSWQFPEAKERSVSSVCWLNSLFHQS